MHYQTAALHCLSDLLRTCHKDALLIYAEKQAAQRKRKQSHIHPRSPLFSMLRHAFIHGVGGLANFFCIGVRETSYVSCMATTSETHAQGTALQHQSAAPRAQASRCKNRQGSKEGVLASNSSSAKQASARQQSFQHPICDVRYCEIGHGDWVEHCTKADVACEQRPPSRPNAATPYPERKINQSAWAHMVAAGCSMLAVE